MLRLVRQCLPRLQHQHTRLFRLQLSCMLLHQLRLQSTVLLPQLRLQSTVLLLRLQSTVLRLQSTLLLPRLQPTLLRRPLLRPTSLIQSRRVKMV